MLHESIGPRESLLGRRRIHKGVRFMNIDLTYYKAQYFFFIFRKILNVFCIERKPPSKVEKRYVARFSKGQTLSHGPRGHAPTYKWGMYFYEVSGAVAAS